MEHRRTQRLVQWAWVSYALLLFIVTHQPIPVDMELLEHNRDKLLHAAAYFGLTLLSGAAHWKWVTRSGARLAILIFGLLAYAALDEILQGPVGRNPDVIDWLCDGAGIGFGVATGAWFVKQLIHSSPAAVQNPTSEPTASSP